MTMRLAVRGEPAWRRMGVKAAGLGESGDDTSFEQSFASLATAYIANKAPALLAYEVGFQLVDRDEDANKACGVFGFKAGPTWLLAPVFFVDGQLKGNELLYDKGQDQFILLDEGWVTHTLSKRPARMGEPVDRNSRELGVRSPNLERSLTGPGKYARVLNRAEQAEVEVEATALMAKVGAAAGPLRTMPAWAQAGLLKMAASAARQHEIAPHLLDVIADGGVKMANTLNRYLADYPRLRAGFDAFYTPEALTVAVGRAVEKTAAVEATRAAARIKAARRRPLGDIFDAIRREKIASRLTIHRFAGFGRTHGLMLDDAEREKLASEGILIKDERDDEEVSKAFEVNLKLSFPTAFVNPGETGTYDVLMKEGELERCLVTHSPVGAARNLPWCTVVRLESGKRAFLNTHQDFIWTAKGVGDERKDNWFDDLDAPKAESAEVGGYYLAVGVTGEATVPFRVVASRGSGPAGGKTYDVLFDTHAAKGRSAASTAAGYRASGLDLPEDGAYEADRDGQRVHLGQEEGVRLRAHRGDLYVPSGFKLVKLEEDASDPEGDDIDKPDGGGMDGKSGKPDPIHLGEALDLQAGIVKKTAGLKIAVDAAGVDIDGRRYSRDEALVYLVRGVGLREDAAREAMECGAASWKAGRKAANFRVKLADPYRGGAYLNNGGPYAPDVDQDDLDYDDTFGEQQARSQHAQEYPVEDMQPDADADDSYRNEPDPMAIQSAQDAASQGQREAFDTTVIGSLLRGTSDNMLVDRYMPDQMKSLHNWGAMLFSFYWHPDRFAERYGSGEMDELEDSLQNTFGTVGRTVLYLLRKTTVAMPAEEAESSDLDEVADQ